ncbi:unnamed protein product, partial [Prorocentrum cordatum]
HDSVAKYLEWVFSEAIRHHNFANSRGIWIQLHNKDPQAVRLKSAEHTNHLKSPLTTHTSGRKTPGLVFVELPECERDFGNAPEEIQSTEIIGGVETKGVLMMAPGEKKGYHHVEEYDDKATTTKTVVDHGDVELVGDQVGSKMQATIRASRDKNAAQAKKLEKVKPMAHPLEGIMSGLAKSGFGTSSAASSFGKRSREEGDDGSDDDGSDGSEGNGSDDASSSSESVSDDGLEQRTSNPLRDLSMAGSAKALERDRAARQAALGSVAPSTGKKATKSPWSSSGGGGAPSPAPPPQKRALSQPPPALPPAQKRRWRPPTKSLVDATGAGNEAFAKVAAEIAALATEVTQKAVFHETQNLAIKEEAKAFKKIMTAKQNDLAALEKKHTTVQGKLKKLEGSFDITDLDCDLKVIDDVLTASKALVTGMINGLKGSDLDDVAQAISTIEANSESKITFPHKMALLTTRLDRAAQFNQHVKFADLLDKGKEHIKDILDSECEEEALEERVLQLVEAHASKLLKALTHADIGRHVTPLACAPLAHPRSDGPAIATVDEFSKAIVESNVVGIDVLRRQFQMLRPTLLPSNFKEDEIDASIAAITDVNEESESPVLLDIKWSEKWQVLKDRATLSVATRKGATGADATLGFLREKLDEFVLPPHGCSKPDIVAKLEEVVEFDGKLCSLTKKGTSKLSELQKQAVDEIRRLLTSKVTSVCRIAITDFFNSVVAGHVKADNDSWNLTDILGDVLKKPFIQRSVPLGDAVDGFKPFAKDFAYVCQGPGTDWDLEKMSQVDMGRFKNGMKLFSAREADLNKWVELAKEFTTTHANEALGKCQRDLTAKAKQFLIDAPESQVETSFLKEVGMSASAAYHGWEKNLPRTEFSMDEENHPDPMDLEGDPELGAYQGWNDKILYSLLELRQDRVKGLADSLEKYYLKWVHDEASPYAAGGFDAAKIGELTKSLVSQGQAEANSGRGRARAAAAKKATKCIEEVNRDLSQLPSWSNDRVNFIKAMAQVRCKAGSCNSATVNKGIAALMECRESLEGTIHTTGDAPKEIEAVNKAIEDCEKIGCVYALLGIITAPVMPRKNMAGDYEKSLEHAASRSVALDEKLLKAANIFDPIIKRNSKDKRLGAKEKDGQAKQGKQGAAGGKHSVAKSDPSAEAGTTGSAARAAKSEHEGDAPLLDEAQEVGESGDEGAAAAGVQGGGAALDDDDAPLSQAI